MLNVTEEINFIPIGRRDRIKVRIVVGLVGMPVLVDRHYMLIISNKEEIVTLFSKNLGMVIV